MHAMICMQSGCRATDTPSLPSEAACTCSKLQNGWIYDRGLWPQGNDANPTLQFKDAKELEGKEGSHKIVGLAYIAPPSQGGAPQRPFYAFAVALEICLWYQTQETMANKTQLYMSCKHNLLAMMQTRQEETGRLMMLQPIGK